MELELHVDADSLLGHLTEKQRRYLDSLDAACINLMSVVAPAKADVEALAEAVIAFCDGRNAAYFGHESGA
ncbi:hypothetical protein [Agrobacterium cavarae]|uniref:hypothetical protein n=1 Tax=Agrobacterium cavarae TaxID=2528239 RepID=UPI0028B0CF7B|nr:hypothetical protein [Agrobacterium cavarae]